MAQTVVPKFYSTRKRFKEPVKNVRDVEKEKVSDILKISTSKETVDFKKAATDVQKEEASSVLKNSGSLGINAPKKSIKNEKKEKISDLPKNSGSKKTGDSKKNVKKSTKGKKVNKVTDYFKSNPETSKKSKDEIGLEKNETCRTPKRNLSTPEESTPSKKKVLTCHEDIIGEDNSPAKLHNKESVTPRKLDSVVCRKLQLNSPKRFGSPKKLGSPLKKNELSPQKAAMYEKMTNSDLASIVNESRSKILFSGRLEELKKSLEKFSSVAAKNKEFQSNSCKITSVISSAKVSTQESKPIIQGEPAYKKFSSLAASQVDSSLILPYKYKVLAEAFRSLDIVVQMLHNRKERITFEKVQNGVQKIMKKNFLMSHLGQILTVLPAAYSLAYEKIESYTLSKTSSPYHLVITPRLSSLEGNSKEQQNAFVCMSPQHVLERRNEFSYYLLEIVKKHHRDFLKKIDFPVVSDENIVRWHPKFPVDSVPDIPIATLPEEPEVKVSSAKDVLNKIRGTVKGRVEKALQAVSEEHKNESKEKGLLETGSKKSSAKKENPALKGICIDLLEKIRARESTKLIETMTRSVQDEKRLAMLDRIPKIAHIIWHYFIAERKAAVPVDAAVEKIRHSLNSLSTPEDIKEHLQLIMETMPGWLSLIKISRGEFLTMDKKKDLNVMLANLK